LTVVSRVAFEDLGGLVELTWQCCAVVCWLRTLPLPRSSKPLLWHLVIPRTPPEPPLHHEGAALELSTILAPNLFLPLACTANLAKNLAAVANSSTRAPIYRTFALQNNLVGGWVWVGGVGCGGLESAVLCVCF